MHRSTLAVLAVLTLVACERPTSPAAPVVSPRTGTAVASVKAVSIKTNEWQDISGTLTACDGAEVFLSGRIHVSTTTTLEPDASTVKIHENFDALEGVGSDGLKYRLVAAAHAFEVHEAEPPFGVSQDVVINETLVSQSDADNLRIQIHQTVEFDGTNTTVTTKRMVTECRG